MAIEEELAPYGACTLPPVYRVATQAAQRALVEMLRTASPLLLVDRVKVTRVPRATGSGVEWVPASLSA
jgi:hypothetical protein